MMKTMVSRLNKPIGLLNNIFNYDIHFRLLVFEQWLKCLPSG